MSSATDDPLAKKEKRLHAEHDISKLRVIQSQTDSKPAKYAMSVGAASIAETCTYPLDLTKTRLQLQGEVAAGEKSVLYRGMFQTAYGIFKEEGLLCLWRGMLPALYRHAIYTGMRMSVYEEVRTTLQKENKVSNKKFTLYLDKHFFYERLTYD